MKKFIPYLFVLYITVSMIIYPAESINYAKDGLLICHDIIIPSLFPFFVCAGLLTASGMARTLAKFASPVMRPLFNINGSGALALVLGIISGYPLGAVTACNLYESGYLSKTEAERLLAFCNNSGPLFILGSVGVSIYASTQIGVALYISHILASLLVGIIFRFYKKDSHVAPKYDVNQPDLSFSEVFSDVLTRSLNSILMVSGAIIFFSVVGGILQEHILENSKFSAFLLGLLELTGGTNLISRTDFSMISKLTLSAFTIGFAGLCVHLQVMAIAKKQYLSIVPYIIGKCFHGIIAAVFTYLYVKLFFKSEIVFNSTASPISAGFCMASAYSVLNVLFIAVLAGLIILFGRTATKKDTSSVLDFPNNSKARD